MEFDLASLSGFGVARSFLEGDVLLRAGEVPSHVFYVVSGALRLYFYSGDREVTLEFFFDGSGVSSFASFHSGTPSVYWIQAIEDSVVFCIPKSKLRRLERSIPEYAPAYLQTIEKRLEYYIARLQSFLALDAKGRYEDLVAKAPQVVQRVKQHYLASFLGIVPESLSRIRRQRIRS